MTVRPSSSSPDADQSDRADRRHRVVIVGGGFGGLPASRLLGGKPVDVTLHRPAQ